MTEQNHGNRGIDVNELVRKDLAKGTRKGPGSIISPLIDTLTGRIRIRPKKQISTVDWLQTKLVSRGSRNK